jgi:Cof subfamily protein (haloacid dehalogenase superfamily)
MNEGKRRPGSKGPGNHAAENRLRPVTPHTVSDQVAEQLRRLITSGDFKPGDRIPAERDLAARLGVGRPAVREALRELKAQGLLLTGRGAQGTTVAGIAASPSFAEPLGSLMGKGAERIIELMEIRSAVEIEAAELAARRATLEDLHRMSIALTAPGEVLTPEEDVAFHATIAEATHNPLFEKVIQEPVELLHDHMAAIFAAYYREPGGAITLQQQHDAIRLAIRSGDEHKARHAMRQHLEYVARGLAQLVGAGRVVRLVFVDLDGTLLSGPRHISERSKRTVANVRESGVEVVLVSSRPPRQMRAFHQELGLLTPMIACNGALLWNVQAAAGLIHAPVDPHLAMEIVQTGRQLGAIANLESDDEWFTDRIGNLEPDSVKDYEMFDPHGIGTVDEVLRSGEPIDKVFLDFRDLDPAEASAAAAAVERAFGKRATVSEVTPGVVDIVSQEASKAAMAQKLAKQMQIPAEQTMAIGDDDTDAAMLQWAGIGVAMGNATPDCKAAADMITSSNLRDGVAEALEQWLLGSKSLGVTTKVPKPGVVAK